MSSAAKQLIVATLALSLSLGLWLLLLASAVSQSLLLAVLAALCALFWVSMTTLSLGIIEDFPAMLLLVIGIPITVSAVAFGSLTALAASLILVLVLGAAYRRIRLEVTGRIHYQPVRTFYAGCALVVLGGIVAAVGILVPQVMVQVDKGTFIIQLPDQTVAAILRPFDHVIQSFFPDYSESASLNELIDRSLARQTGNTPLPAEAMSQQRAQVHANLSRYTGTHVSGQETVPDLVSEAVNTQLVTTLTQNPLVASIIGIALLLLFARVAIPLIAWPGVALIALLVSFGRRLKFLQLAEVPATVERLRL